MQPKHQKSGDDIVFWSDFPSWFIQSWEALARTVRRLFLQHCKPDLTTHSQIRLFHSTYTWSTSSLQPHSHALYKSARLISSVSTFLQLIPARHNFLQPFFFGINEPVGWGSRMHRKKSDKPCLHTELCSRNLCRPTMHLFRIDCNLSHSDAYGRLQNREVF